MAFDFGLKSIGVATGQISPLMASPLHELRARDGVPNWTEIEKLLAEWQPTRLLVGLPLNMDGTEGDLCQRARRFAGRLQGRFGCPVELVDERLTSRSARLEARDMSAKPNRDRKVDSIAACLILEQYLHQTLMSQQ